MTKRAILNFLAAIGLVFPVWFLTNHFVKPSLPFPDWVSAIVFVVLPFLAIAVTTIWAVRDIRERTDLVAYEKKKILRSIFLLGPITAYSYLRKRTHC